MALILQIDTAVDAASICLSREGIAGKISGNQSQKDQAGWLHTAIRDIVKEEANDFAEIDAVAVSIGPGSYTGLRIGLSTAKGLCYALKRPLLAVGTLEIIATPVNKTDADLFCPMIDARRMDVFAAVYNRDMIEIMKPAALTIQPDSFADFLAKQRICFCGNGQKKLQKIITHPNAVYDTTPYSAADMTMIATRKFVEKDFADLAYVEPLYVKEFYSSAS